MSVSIIDQSYNAGAEFAQKGILTIDVINDFRTDYFHKFCNQIRSVIEKRVQEEKDLFEEGANQAPEENGDQSAWQKDIREEIEDVDSSAKNS